MPRFAGAAGHLRQRLGMMCGLGGEPLQGIGGRTRASLPIQRQVSSDLRGLLPEQNRVQHARSEDPADPREDSGAKGEAARAGGDGMFGENPFPDGYMLSFDVGELAVVKQALLAAGRGVGKSQVEMLRVDFILPMLSPFPDRTVVGSTAVRFRRWLCGHYNSFPAGASGRSSRRRKSGAGCKPRAMATLADPLAPGLSISPIARHGNTFSSAHPLRADHCGPLCRPAARRRPTGGVSRPRESPARRRMSGPLRSPARRSAAGSALERRSGGAARAQRRLHGPLSASLRSHHASFFRPARISGTGIMLLVRSQGKSGANPLWLFQ